MTMNIRLDGSMRQPGVPDGIPESGSALANVAQWVQQQNANLQQLSSHSSSVNFSSPPDGQGLRPNGRYGRMMQQWGGSSPGPHPMPQEVVGPQGYPMCGPQPGFPPDMNIGGPNDLLHGSVPKENLTPQQLQKREEGLAHLRKIGQMLNIDSSGSTGPGPMMHMHGNPDGLMPGEGWPGPMMHPNMGIQRPRMAMSPTDSMMGMNFTQRIGPLMGPGGLPPDWDNMTPEQRDWHKMQHEFYLEKCRKQQMQMGMNVPPGAGGGGPNRSHVGFFHPMQQMHRMPGPMSPVPPTFQGSSVSSPHCGPMVNPNDPQVMMFTKQSEFGGMCQGMGPDQNFDHPGGMPREGMFPFPDGSMPSGRLGSMSGESFSPAEFSHPAGQQGMVKMTPAFGPQKRKRSANTMSDPEDIYKRLLPAPSPQQFSYMNSLDGQELTITKQLNHAFQEQSGAQVPPPPSSSPATYPPPQKSRSSGSKKKKTQAKTDQKPKSQRTPPAADPFTCPSPAVPASAVAATTSASFQSVPAASPISQTSVSSLSSSFANVISTPTSIANRASSADPNTGPSVATATTVATPVMKSSMTNITSASLANLAKGVENLSAQIQHNPFRTVQMQENESDVSDVSPPDNSSLLPSIGTSHGPGPQTTNPQNNNGLGNSHGGPMHPMQSSNSSMQQMTPTHLMGSPPGSVRSASHSMAPKQGSSSLTDPASLMTCGRQSSPIFPGDEQGLDPGSRFCFTGSTAMPTGPSSSQQMFAQMGPSSGTSSCRPTNGGNMVTGNAKIQIQAQTPNTIQYLPSGGHPGDGMGDGFMEFQMDAKSCGKGGMPPYSAMMDGIHGSMMPGDMMQRRQMDFQMMQDAGGGAMHPQMRMDAAFDPMHGPRGSMHGPRGSIAGPTGSMHMPVGSMHGPGSPILTSSGMMHMGNPMHGPGSPAMGPSGSMHDQTSPMMGPGSMMGPGGHMMGELLQMQGHMKQGMSLNGSADFGAMVMGPGGRGADMLQDMEPMTMSHRSMHPDAMMMSGASPPEFGGPHRGDPTMMSLMSGCGGMMGPEMSMGTIGSREGMMAMRGAPGMRPEMVIERSRSNRSRQKARAAEAVESRIRNEAVAAAGMMAADVGAGRMGGPGVMSMDMMSGMMRSEMGMMGMRPDVMGMSGMGPGDRMVMRAEPGMMVQRGNGMPPEMAMMSSRGTATGRMGMMEGMPQDSVGMFNFGPGRRGMPPEAMDMMPPGMNPSGMCPPGMKSMVMGGSGIGQPPGSGMGPDPGYGVPYQQFQQQLYAQSRSPTMSPGMMRGGMPGGPADMMGRPPYDVMGPGPSMTPGSGMGFGQPQPGLGPM